MMPGIVLPFAVGVSPALGIRGIVATEKITKNQIIERCMAIIYPKNPEIMEQTIFDHYVFDWDETHEALVLGYGSLCNHSYERNVSVDFDYEKKEIVFSTLHDIGIGESY